MTMTMFFKGARHRKRKAPVLTTSLMKHSAAQRRVRGKTGSLYCGTFSGMNFKPGRQYGRAPLPLEAVEPASEIVKRFRTGSLMLWDQMRSCDVALAAQVPCPTGPFPWRCAQLLCHSLVQ